MNTCGLYTFRTTDGRTIAGKQRYASRRNAERGRVRMSLKGYWTTDVRRCVTWPDEWGYGYARDRTMSSDLKHPPLSIRHDPDRQLKEWTLWVGRGSTGWHWYVRPPGPMDSEPIAEGHAASEALAKALASQSIEDLRGAWA